MFYHHLSPFPLLTGWGHFKMFTSLNSTVIIYMRRINFANSSSIWILMNFKYSFQVYERIKAPLLTLVSSGSPEQSYAVLSHLHLLVMRAPYIFSSDYKHFYCQYNEPFYVKKLKLEMLTAVANESNTYEIGNLQFVSMPKTLLG